MTNFWSGWIVLLTLTCLALVIWILAANWKNQRKTMTTETTGHKYDGIEEFDNPMPKWWLMLFVATFIFAAGYLLLYPGLGKWKGYLGWTSTNELARHELKHERKFAPLFKQYADKSIETLQNNPKALKIGKRIFLNNCAICHGSDAKGNYGFPNLREGSWLWGGSSEKIVETLLYGRRGQMPAWGTILGEKNVANVARYTRSLSGIKTGATGEQLLAGKKIFETTCSTCHGTDGKGNHALGAPNLTDKFWLYDSSQAHVMYTIRNGRNGVMPAWKDILGEDKVHLVAAYIYNISRNKEPEKN